MQDDVSHPVSFYGATKVSNELMAHSYSHLYKSQPRALGFLPYMVPGDDRICRNSFSLAIYWPQSLSMFTIMAIWKEISPISMTS